MTLRRLADPMAIGRQAATGGDRPMAFVRLEMVSRAVVGALLSALLLLGIATATSKWNLSDLHLYLAAAEELKAGGSPYDIVIWEHGLPYYYHYAPWLSAVFVPLSALPVEAVRVAWSAVLLVATCVALIPLVRRFGWRATPFGALMVFLLAGPISEGNVQPLLLVGLVWTLERRSGPIMIGIAASLKLVPILLALVYVGRRQWGRAATACLVTAVLLAPALVFEIPPHAMESGGTGLFTAQPALWAATLIGAVAIALLVARTRYAWLAASTATILALPRLLAFDATNLLTSLPAKRREP